MQCLILSISLLIFNIVLINCTSNNDVISHNINITCGFNSDKDREYLFMLQKIYNEYLNRYDSFVNTNNRFINIREENFQILKKFISEEKNVLIDTLNDNIMAYSNLIELHYPGHEISK